ncbi:ATP-binding protein [Aeoliella straminimaris]|uniref:ATP-binding protein n=1 Tax=Aeoliella straminimaris TaxID=2954799 RepID=UPI002093C069|nr:ATP-binding protein [Aeoliella straminimaris]
MDPIAHKDSRLNLPVNNVDLPTTRLAVNAPWLVKLRWVAVVGQLATILFVQFGLDVPLPLVPLVAALAVTAATNAALDRWVRQAVRQRVVTPRKASGVIAAVMLLDLVALTVMLYVTGGPTNPFVVFYVVNLALAGVLLEPHLAWVLMLVACAGMTLLFWHRWPVEVLSDPARLTSMASQQQLPLAAMGELVALVAGTGVIVAFITRVTSELRASQRAQQRAEERRARSEKLEALGTLAAGAAHELATPLSTIAVVVNEVQRELAAHDLPEHIAADLELVRRELARCRTILDRMSFDAGQSIGEALERITTGDLVELVIEDMSAADRVHVEADEAASQRLVQVPPVAVAQAIRGLVQNGLDASTDVVVINVTGQPAKMQLAIVDRGTGMPPEVLARAGDPFFTTKQPGQGMGLGLFLARSVVERLGGSLDIQSAAGEGTTAVVELPTSD